MRSALVNYLTNIVENFIVADPAVDPAPDGFLLIALAYDTPVYIGWLYDPETGQFTDPNPPTPEPDVP